MKIELELNGKKKTYKSNKITFKTFREGTSLLKRFNEGDFLENDYNLDDLDEAVDLIVGYFHNQFTRDEFYDGYMLEDAIDFMAVFQEVLVNIQMNNGKRELLEEVGKKEAQTKE